MNSRSAFKQRTLVALTGWSQGQDQQRSRMVGFDHHVSEPADIGALQRLLRLAHAGVRRDDSFDVAL